MYKLLKDKNNEFQCEIRLEGASAKGAKVRLFLEADGCEYVFTGAISNDKCSIPMGKLKKYANLLESGRIRLEVVADDTLFTPYESDYQLEEERKVTVEVKQQVETVKKPMVEVKVNEVAPTPKPDPLLEVKNYLKTKTAFNGTAKSFLTAIKNSNHKKFFNTFCESRRLNKSDVIKQILK